MGEDDPQDPLRVPVGRDDEEEQGAARALLPEDLPPVVGTPGPGEGAGTGAGWTSRGVRTLPAGGRGTRRALWGMPRTRRRTEGSAWYRRTPGWLGGGGWAPRLRLLRIPLFSRPPGPRPANAEGGTNSQEDHLILLGEFFEVCQENHTRLKLEKCEFMQETMQYLGFDIGYGWWTPAASKAKPLMDAKVRHENRKKGLHDVRSFIEACNFYRRHIKNFTYSSAILTDFIKNSTTWRWGPQEQQAFDKLKNKVAHAKCLGVPRAQGEMILVTDASNVGGSGTLFQ